MIVWKALLNKEFRLNMHPAAPMFVLLSAMVLIPNYPLYVAFFYTALGLFFTCLQGREDRDLAFTMTLPVRKRQIVGARFLFALIIEGAQLVLCVAFAALRNRIMPNPRNMAGMDANVAFFGGALAVLSLCSGITGLTLGVNPLNALVLGILGAPGLALLCALNVLTG